MFKNHLKVAIRNLLKQKVYSLINVTGLAIGLASCGVILLYIQKEISYDNYHQDIDQLYRVAIWKDATGQKQGGACVSYEMAEVLRHDYPEVISAVRLYQPAEPAVVKIDDRQFSESRFCFAEPSVFDIFTMRFLRGNREATVQKPNTVVVTEEIARKYFGTLDVLDKTLTINLNNQNLDFKITGVVENPPPNTHFKYGLLASFENVLVAAFNQDFFKSWFNYPIWTYLKLQKGTRATDLEGKLALVVKKYFPPTRKTSRLFLQPVRDIHLHSHLDDELEGNSDIIYIYIFSVIALLVLVIAGINFMNLTTAKSMNRAREVGMRKVLGAYRAQLIKQFLAEAMLVSGIAVVVALGLIELFLRLFNEIATINLELSYSKNMVWIIGFIVFALSAGLLSGVYPAFFLSAFRPIKTLKGAFSKSTGGGGLRKALVVFQMAITIALLVSIATISRQLDFVRNKKLGFQKEQIVLISVNGTALRDANKYDSFKNQILQMPEVKGVTTNSRSMGEVIRIRSIFFHGINESEKIALPYIFVGHDYATVYGLEFVEGRDFSKAFSTDTNWVYIVNESAVREYDLQPAVGRMIASGDLNPRRGQIVGVVKDFHFSTLHDKIEPLVIGLYNIPFGYISVKLESDALPRTLQQIEAVWKRFEPDRPMEFSFLDEKLDQAYRFEAQLGKVVSYFTALAIFIACLGLFAMAAYAAEQRTKEIGIRKVLGASVAGLILLLSKDFTRLVLLGFAIAVPMAYFVMNRWLSDFAYRIELGPGIFLLAGGITLVIAWLTVSYQSIKAALANPLEALRYE